MFLRPHHLQQHDLFVESREIGYVRAIDHFGWGLIRLEIQEDSLHNFVLAVRSLRAILPDGTLVEVPGNAQLPSRTFDPKDHGHASFADMVKAMDTIVEIKKGESDHLLRAR